MQNKNFSAVLLMAFCIFIILLFNFISWPLFSIARDDDVHYIASGIDLVNGKYTETRMPPFYPLLIGLATKVSGDGFFSAKIISAICGCLVILPLYYLSKNIYSRNVALLSVFLASIFPYRIILSNAAKTESVYTFLILIGSCLFFVLTKKQAVRVFLSLLLGLVLSALYLTRPEGLVYLLVFLSYLLIFKKEFLNKEMGINTSIFVTVFAVFLMIYMFYLHKQTGLWILSGKYKELLFSDWISNGGDYHHLLKLNDEASKIVTANPYRNYLEAVLNAAVRYVHNSYNMLVVISRIFSPAFLIFLGMGIFEMLKNAFDRKKIFLLFLVMPMFVYPLFHIQSDYLYPQLFLILIIAARGLIYLGDYIKAKRAYFIISILLISTIFLQNFLLAYKDIKSLAPIEKKAIGIWMNKNLPEGNVMDIEPISTFYAKMPFVLFPFAEFNRTISYAKKNKVNYIILTKRDKFRYNPEISRLFDAPEVPPEIELIRRDSTYKDFEVLLFKLKN